MDHCRRISLVLAALLLLVPLSGAARENLAPHQMPALEGHSFAGKINASGREAIAVFNITDEMVSLYLYFPDENLLRVLYSVPANVIRSGNTWDITIPTRGIAFTRAKDADESVTIAGGPTNLEFLARGEVEQRVPMLKATECASTEASDTPRVQSPRPLPARSESLFTCTLAAIFNGCCTSCYCVHRDLGIPEWMDGICCGGGC